MDLRKIDKTELESLLTDMKALDAKSKLILGEDVSSVIKIKIRLTSRSAEDALVEAFIDKVCLYRDVPKDKVTTKSRKKDICFARHMIASLLRKYTLLGLETIGTKLGGKHHTTIMHSLLTHQDMIDTDSNYRNDYLKIEDELNEEGIVGFEQKSVLTITDIRDELKQRVTKEA
jgi:chromosomal replication initiation ATPase DnaA